MASGEVRREVRQARQEGKTVLPVKGPGLQDLSSLPRWMGHVYDLDLPLQFDALVQHLRLPSQQKRVPMMAPEPPADYVHRPAEFDPLKARLLDPNGDAVAITAALRGAGGYGKTTLAKKLASDPDIQNAYLDGILWVELGEKPPNLLSVVNDLVTRLTGRPPQLETINAAAAALAEALGERRILLVVDDIWREQDLRPFLRGGPNTTRLVTTRIDSTAPANAFRQKVDALDGAEAVSLLSAGLPAEEVGPMRVQLAKVAGRLGEWPLVLKLVNGFLRHRTLRMRETLPNALRGAINRLEAKGFTAFDPRDDGERTLAVSRTIGISMDMLDAASRERFTELAVFPEDVDVPIDVTAAYWSAGSKIDAIDTEDLLGHLESLSLLLNVDMTQRTFRLHDTIRHFLREQAGATALEKLHRCVVNVLDAPTDNREVTSYRFTRMLEHLAAAGEQDRINTLLLDPAWLSSKLAANSASASLAEDYRVHGSTRMHRYVGRTLQLCAGILARDGRQLAPQIIGRLGRCEEHERENFLSKLREAAPHPSLIPELAGLTPPGAETARLEGHRTWISALAVTSKGRIVSGGFDRTIRIWDIGSGFEVAILFNVYGGRI